MRRRRQLRKLTLVLVAALTVCMSGLALAQDLYKCTTPAGRLVMSNLPCPAGQRETVIERQEGTLPSSTTTPRASRASARPPASASTPPVFIEPDVPAPDCANINDVATEVLNLGRFRYHLKWKVHLSNRCRRLLPVVLTFGLFDKNDFEIRAARRRLRLPARDSLIAQGTLALSQSELQRISAKKAAVQLR